MTILAHVERRVNRRTVRREVRQHRAQARRVIQVDRQAAQERYRGGLPAETESLAVYVAGAKQQLRGLRREVRRSVLRRCGRKIDLLALFAQRRENGDPAWALVDPRVPIGSRNGLIDVDGMFLWGGEWVKYLSSAQDSQRQKRKFSPIGMPAIPDAVRRLCRDRAINRRAKRIGVLYQPEAWIEVSPDPALVVEWRDLPDEYYALAVWGVDGPRIMEFVD